MLEDPTMRNLFDFFAATAVIVTLGATAAAPVEIGAATPAASPAR